jgi:hypothetical protein
MVDTVIVKKFVHRHEAELAKNILAEEGVEAVVCADDCGGCLNISAAAVKLMVKKKDADRASEILKVLDSDSK